MITGSSAFADDDNENLRRLAPLERGAETSVHLEGVTLEYPLLVVGAHLQVVDVALCIVEVEPGLRIVPLHGADHLGGEQDVLHRNDLGEKVDARLVIDEGVEEHVLEQ